MCYYGNMFDHDCAALVFLWSAMVAYPCNIHKVSRPLTGKKEQSKKKKGKKKQKKKQTFCPDDDQFWIWSDIPVPSIP